MTPGSQQLTCLLVGEGTLPARCGEILLSAGHRVCGVVSAEPAVRQWAVESAIPVASPGEAADTRAFEKPFDYLFTIGVPFGVDGYSVRPPLKWAVGYHDSLLPKYPGPFAAAWALIHRETIHGVTWYLAAGDVPAGGILEQRAFDIAERETASTLNAKCCLAALDSFTALVEDLGLGTARPLALDACPGDCRSGYERPPGLGIIPLRAPAAGIDALVRALQFGDYPNPFGSAKLAVGDTFLVVTKTRLLGADTGFPPGTLVRVSRDGLVLATGDREIELGGFTSLSGAPMTPPEVVASFGLRVGAELPECPPERVKQLAEYDCRTMKREAYWVRRLSEAQRPSLAFGDTAAAGGARSVGSSLRLPERTPSPTVPDCGLTGRQAFLLAGIVVYLARIADHWQFDVDLRRHVAEAAEFEGLFAPEVPLRVELAPSCTFLEAVRRICEAAGETLSHGTFLRDVEARFPVLRMGFRKAGDEVRVLIDPAGDPSAPPGSTDRELTFVFSDDGAELGCVCREHLLDTSATRILEQLSTLLDSAAASPGQTIGALALVPAEERSRLLVEWNDTVREFPERCAHRLFEAQVEKAPDAVAVVCRDERVSYAGLNRRANCLAACLLSQGIGAGARVGIYLPRSVDMVMALLGILKTGAAYVPLDPEYPRNWLRSSMEDAKLAAVVTRSGMTGSLVAGVPVVCVDAVTGGEADCGATVNVDVPLDSVAYVLFTSGSTGKPKCVEIFHRGLANVLQALTKEFSFSAADTLFAVTSLSFDVGTLDVLLPLISGGCVIVAEREFTRDAERLSRALAESGATFMQTTAGTWRMLVESGWQGSPDLRICSGGEPLDRTLADELLARTRALWNCYGPTETAIACTVSRVLPGKEPVTIGRPIANTQLYVLDRRRELVPVGVPGELYVGGMGVARGYLHQPQLTAEKFVPNPFDRVSKSRLCRTGDFVAYFPDGRLQFLGRIDHQVKILGHRVELGELEATLALHPAVRTAVAVCEHRAGQRRLAAYALPNGGSKPSSGELRNFLAERLPIWMLPAHIECLDSLPLTPTGKVDRPALATRSRSEGMAEVSFSAQADGIDLQLAVIWQDLLGVPAGPRQNFFEIGGNSLLALRLFAAIHKSLGVDLPLATLFQAPTIEQLGSIVRASNWSPPADSLVAIRGQGSRPPLFLVHPAGGNVLCFARLALHLGQDQPVYALQSSVVAGDRPVTSIEEMAARYIQEVRKVQPGGPYDLVGFSFGGAVAYEMARRLSSAGHTVGLLALIDTFPPGHQFLWCMPYERTRHHLGRLRQLGWRRGAAYLSARVRGAGDLLGRNLRERLLLRRHPTASGLDAPARNDLAWAAASAAFQRYKPKSYSGSALLLKITNDVDCFSCDLARLWRRLIKGRIDVRSVPGLHGTILDEPSVGILAREIKTALDSLPGRTAPLRKAAEA